MNPASPPEEPASPHSESYLRLFLRFLRFGLLAWGGPVAQIDMIRQELVEEEQWISQQRFNRTLAVYQVLPGPEAHELTVYFGMIARGRMGGFLGGLGFMLPGFVLMFALSFVYVTFGTTLPFFAAIFAGLQAAVVGLIIRAVHRIGRHTLYDRLLLAIALVAGVATLLGVHFLVTLVLAGVAYFLFKRQNYVLAAALGLVLLAASVFLWLQPAAPVPPSANPSPDTLSNSPPTLLTLFGSGLRSGLLTFGGAYTVIPFLQRDAVVVGGWMTNAQFLDGLALSGILPAPLVIFATFVGYIGAAGLGALAMTAGIFLPAFGFTLVGHKYLERAVHNSSLHDFLDGVTAGVVGLIAATSLQLFRSAITGPASLAIFASALFMLYRLKGKATVAVVIIGAGIAGLLLFR